jgi:hypothetical protein
MRTRGFRWRSRPYRKPSVGVNVGHRARRYVRLGTAHRACAVSGVDARTMASKACPYSFFTAVPRVYKIR